MLSSSSAVTLPGFDVTLNLWVIVSVVLLLFSALSFTSAKWLRVCSGLLGILTAYVINTRVSVDGGFILGICHEVTVMALLLGGRGSNQRPPAVSVVESMPSTVARSKAD